MDIRKIKSNLENKAKSDNITREVKSKIKKKSWKSKISERDLVKHLNH